MKFLHISNRHYHSDQQNNVANAHLISVLAEQFPDHVLIDTGDITDDGAEEQYRRVREHMLGLPNRWFFCPGNHDYGYLGIGYDSRCAERFDSMLAMPFQQHGTFAGKRQPVVNLLEDETARVQLIALNSNLETQHPFDAACGEIGDLQLSFLNRILNSAGKDCTTIVFMHHHPFMQHNPFMELLDARDLLRVLYRRADVLLFGHEHKAGIWLNRCGVNLIAAADAAPGSTRLREITVKNRKVTTRTIKWRQS